MMTKKCPKECDARAELLFCWSNLVRRFDVIVAVAVVAAKVYFALKLTARIRQNSDLHFD